MPEEARSDAQEIAEIFSRLRQEIRGRPAALAEGEGLEFHALPSRWNAERLWGVTADRPFESLPGLYGRIRGYVLVPIKLVLRKLMRWYVEPMAAHQRSFNAAVLQVLDELAERETANARRLERRLGELEERVAGLGSSQ